MDGAEDEGAEDMSDAFGPGEMPFADGRDDGYSYEEPDYGEDE